VVHIQCNTLSRVRKDMQAEEGFKTVECPYATFGSIHVVLFAFLLFYTFEGLLVNTFSLYSIIYNRISSVIVAKYC